MEKPGLIAAFALSTLFLVGGCKDQTNHNPMNIAADVDHSFMLLNDAQIERIVVGKRITDRINGPYDQGISFYPNGQAYISNNAGTNVSKYTIRGGYLCFKDFVTICSQFGIRSGRLVKLYHFKGGTLEIPFERSSYL